MRIEGAMYVCDLCGKKDFLTCQDIAEGLAKHGVHKFEAFGLKTICHDCMEEIGEAIIDIKNAKEMQG